MSTAVRFTPAFLVGLLLLGLLLAGAAPVTVAAGAPTASGIEHRLLTDIEDGIARVEPWLQRYGYRALFLTVGVEGIGLPAPGQTILEAAAAAATAGDPHLRIGLVLATAFIAGVLGNTLGYLLGRRGGRPLLARLRLPATALARVEGLFQRYGDLLILFARFFDGPRQLNGIIAGVLGMHWVRFTLLNLLGAALWACFWGLGVYYLDLHLDAVVAVLRRANPWVWSLTLVALFGLLFILLRARQRR
ncbi:MAG: DedA family protein [Chromatiaceae bacterium]|nr:MAG: DedA family protein [Chromatiaceae bacterium]